jgi:hypothetical protein
MKTHLFVMLFCGLIFVGGVSAQERSWTEVPTGMSSMMGTWYMDYSSIRRLPNGNVTFWTKGGGTIYQTEVNCVAKEERTLKRIKYSRADSYGNKVNDNENALRPSDMEWKAISPTSISDNMNGIACRSAKNVTSQSGNSATKKRVVKTARKRKQ